MAIYHFSMKASSSNAPAHFTYIAASDKYESKSDVRFSHDLNMPSCTGSEFWLACEKHERKNGNQYKEFEITLPRELSFDEQEKLAYQFVDKFIPNQPCTLAVHDGKNGDNPHLHLMFSMRENDGLKREDLSQFFKRANKKYPERGGAPKVDKWTDNGYGKEIAAGTREKFLDVARKDVEVLINKALEEAGHDARVDCRSLKDQGITDRLPQPKIGFAAAAIEARSPGVSERVKRFEEVMKFNSDKAIVYKKQEALARDPKALDALIVRFKKIEQVKDKLFGLDRPMKPAKLTLGRVMQGMEYYAKQETGYPQFKQAKQLLDVQYDLAKDASWLNPFNKIKQMLEYNKALDGFQPVKQAWKEGKADLQAKVAQTNKNRVTKHTRALKEYKHKLQDFKLQIEDLKQGIAQDFGSLDKAEFLARQRHADLAPQRQAAAEAKRKRHAEIDAQQRLVRQRERLREQLVEKRNELNSNNDMGM